MAFRELRRAFCRAGNDRSAAGARLVDAVGLEPTSISGCSGGEKRSSQGEERVSSRAKRGVVVKAAPSTAFEVIDTNLAFQFLVVAFDAPAKLHEPN